MDRESYGEDIADTETERSDYSDEDEYEDSFIDDDADPEVFPPSPISNDGTFKYLCSSLSEVKNFCSSLSPFHSTFPLDLVNILCELVYNVMRVCAFLYLRVNPQYSIALL